MITDKHTFRTISIRGKRIPVWVYGQESKPAIVFLHGYPHPFSAYKGDLPMRHMLDYCFYAVDLPGFGESKNLRMNTNEFLDELVKQLVKRPFVVFGISYGGVVALSYAQTHPISLKGIIISGTPFYSRTSIAARLLKAPHRIKLPIIVPVIQSFASLRAQNLKRIQLPVLLLYSKSDTIGTISMATTLKKRLSGATMVTVSDRPHSHLMHNISENEFLPQIRSFLKRVF